MKLICQNCGAEIEGSLPKCPYCDTLIPRGAELQYMRKLYAINQDMEELKDDPLDAVVAEARGQGKRLRGIVISAIVLALILAGIFLLMDRRYDRDLTADYIWGEQNYPAMSELYENGDYEALEALYWQALEEDRALWNWEYYDEFNEWMEEQP